MKRLIAILLVLLFAAACLADTTIFKVNKAGLYQVVDGKIQPVTVVDVDSPDVPVDPVPVPVPTVDTTTAIKTAAQKVTDPNRAKVVTGLAMATAKVRELVDKGTLQKYEQISQAIAYLWDATAKDPSWGPVRKIVMDRLELLAQEGAKPAAYSALLACVEQGLTDSVTQAQVNQWCQAKGTDRETMEAEWTEFLKTLLELFIKFVLPLIIK